MYIIVAVDDNNGMMFNNRRQSRDRVMNEKILSVCEGHNLWMNDYSYNIFQPLISEKDNIRIDADCLKQAGNGDYCFVEDRHIEPFMKAIEGVILFRWNRKYPGDFFFDLDIASDSWKPVSKEEFSGSSHEKITMEVYISEKK